MALIALENCFLVTVPDTFLALAFTCALLRHNDKKTQKRQGKAGVRAHRILMPKLLLPS